VLIIPFKRLVISNNSLADV